MRFGLAIPNCREAAPYPLGFATPEFMREMALLGEELGYYSLWANDHLLSTPGQIESLPRPPHYYEPLMTYSYIAAITKRIKFMIATIVPSLREPALFAKQVAVLDQLSNGRLIVGLGLGSQRDEFEAISLRPKANRGKMMDEFVVAVKRLLDQGEGGVSGDYYKVGDVKMAPPPVQRPFPIYMSGVAEEAVERVGRLGDGWIVSTQTPEQIREKYALLQAAGKQAGRGERDLEICLFTNIAIASTEEKAKEMWEASLATRQARQRRNTSSVIAKPEAAHPAPRTSAGGVTSFIGTPEQITLRLREYEATGLRHVGLVFVGQEQKQLLDGARLFAKEVQPHFQGA